MLQTCGQVYSMITGSVRVALVSEIESRHCYGTLPIIHILDSNPLCMASIAFVHISNP